MNRCGEPMNLLSCTTKCDVARTDGKGCRPLGRLRGRGGDVSRLERNSEVGRAKEAPQGTEQRGDWKTLEEAEWRCSGETPM